MVFVGIDVAKDKHDCFIINSEGEVLADVFTIANSKEGFEQLLHIIKTCTGFGEKTKVGLEATGHYSYNILGFLLDKVKERAALNTSVTRLVKILFPEFEKLLPTLHTASSYALLSELPSAKHIAEAHLTHLTNLLYSASHSHYNRDKAIQIREAARNSIGTYMPAKALELKHTIKLIKEFDAEIYEIEYEIKAIMDKINSPITTIPSIGINMAAMIIAEIGNFDNFDSPDKILAFSGPLHPLINRDNSTTVMHIWRNVVLVICVMLFLM